MQTAKFDIEKIIREYKVSSERQASCTDLLEKSGFINDENTFALIGIGGTISSGYSPAQETIIPKPYKVSLNLIDDLQKKFRINKDEFTAIDLFSKDSRDIVEDDLYLLLDTLSIIKNERVLITCGTYMLPKVTALLIKLGIFNDKVIAVTGSMIPNGFGFSDATMNVLSSITAVNFYVLNKKNIPSNNIFAVFHGDVYDAEDKLNNLDLHPKEIENLIVEYPISSTPYSGTD